jgi:hypothetical protein
LENDVGSQQQEFNLSDYGMYAELTLRVPTMFLYLVNQFTQEQGANHPDAPVIMAALHDAENLMFYEHSDLINIRTNVQ